MCLVDFVGTTSLGNQDLLIENYCIMVPLNQKQLQRTVQNINRKAKVFKPRIKVIVLCLADIYEG